MAEIRARISNGPDTPNFRLFGQSDGQQVSLLENNFEALVTGSCVIH